MQSGSAWRLAPRPLRFYLTGVLHTCKTSPFRGVAQSGSALALGARGPGFESRRPDLFYVYIIRSQRLQRYYVGSTEVVEKRLQEHNTGKSASTRAGTPWELIYTECFTTRSEAIYQEQKIKVRGIGRYLSSIES